MVINSLSQSYERENVLYELSNFLTEDFDRNEKQLNLTDANYENINEAWFLGKNKFFSLFEIYHNKPTDARITLTKMAVHIMKDRGLSCALFFFVPKDKETFRISLVTVDWANNKQASNPRRFSFLVGKGQKLHTAIKQLSTPAVDKADLIKKFSIEVVNDAFYDSISKHFYQLIQEIKHPAATANTEEGFKTLQNFSVRLIGRLIFCWFLKKKYRTDGTPLIPEDLLSTQAIKDCQDSNYYHEILEPLFFETLNKEVQNRIPKCKQGAYAKIPFLNGGLFSPKDDVYKLEQFGQSAYYNNLIIKNSWFESLFEVLETYNFTIDENTSSDIDLAVDPEMLGRIFENLLAAINPETQESVRKATGSYYTPREIVDYMVNQSLKQYLYTKTDIEHKKIDSLFEFEPELDNLSLTQKQTIYTVLSKIKVLDPAVGSGAFPMGVLQKIMLIIHIIDPNGEIYKSLPEANIDINSNLTKKSLDYANKLTLIQKCIYGVDIQPMAIEICRLRFFLTLIVEEESDNPKPLPNLNFNFACANSLVALDNNNILELKQKREKLLKAIKEKETEISLLLNGENIFELSQKKKEKINVIKKELDKFNKEKDIIKKQFEKADINTFLNGENYIAQLRAYRKEFFAASGERKEFLKKKFIETQDRMLDALQANDWGNEKVIKLQAWKPFENNSTGWFDPSWMFGIEDGFDIVIGNPPYNELRDLPEYMQSIYQNSYLHEYAQGGRENLYQYFYPFTVFCAKLEGIICLLTQNSLLAEHTAFQNRKLLFSQTQVVEINSFPERDNILKRVFKNVKMSVCIGLFQKNREIDKKKSFSVHIWKDRYLSNKETVDLSVEEIIDCFPRELIIPITSNRKFSLFKKIKNISNKIFLSASAGEIDVKKYKNLFTRDVRQLRVVTGAQIQKYYITDKPSQGEIYYLPENILSHLTNERLEAIQTSRIALQRITGVDSPIRIIATLVKENFLCANSTNYIKCSSKKTNLKYYILGILNSKLLNFFFKQTSTNTNVTTSELSKLPIRIVNENITNQIVSIVCNILSITQTDDYLDNINKQNKVKQYQDEIDQMVYKLYGLTEEEIKIVEESQSNKE